MDWKRIFTITPSSIIVLFERLLQKKATIIACFFLLWFPSLLLGQESENETIPSPSGSLSFALGSAKGKLTRWDNKEDMNTQGTIGFIFETTEDINPHLRFALSVFLSGASVTYQPISRYPSTTLSNVSDGEFVDSLIIREMGIGVKHYLIGNEKLKIYLGGGLTLTSATNTMKINNSKAFYRGNNINGEIICRGDGLGIYYNAGFHYYLKPNFSIGWNQRTSDSEFKLDYEYGEEKEEEIGGYFHFLKGKEIKKDNYGSDRTMLTISYRFSSLN